MVRVLIGALLVWLGLAECVLAENRVALIIGNGAYRAVNALPNPSNDAKLMAATLTNLGFTVTLVTDADMLGMNQAVSKFGRELREAGPEATGLFYYAGHGVQSFGRNYLLPVDAQLDNAADLGLVSVDAEFVLRQMASARNRTNIVILDACRNNPFTNIRDLGDNGLAEMSAPTGTFLAYATAPGQVALDGLDGDSPFTKALAERILTPGAPIEQIFKEVRVEVLEVTKGRQTPWDTSSLTNEFIFLADLNPTSGDEAALWNAINATRDPVQIMLFLRAYPKSSHIEAARAMLAEAMLKEVGGPTKGLSLVPTTPDPVPPAAPTAEEVAAFEAALTTRTKEAFVDFQLNYPNSQFGEAVVAEIAAIEAATPRAAEPTPEPVPEPPPSAEVIPGPVDPALIAQIEGDVITFTTPLKFGTPDMVGKTLEELITSSPVFAPIEGLPDEVWMGKHCTDCHQWTQADLCMQGTFFVNDPDFAPLTTHHPLGGAFRVTMRKWASDGCP